MALPSVAGFAALYVLISAYLDEIESFLSTPDPQGASLILGIASLTFFLMLFLHVVLRASLAALALGLPAPGWKFFPTARPIWRLYAANLRLMLIALPVAAIVVKYGALPGRPTPLFSDPDYFSIPVLIDALAFLVFVYVAARTMFLMPSVTLCERGQIVRRAWGLATDNVWRLIAISIALAIPGILLQIVLETVFQAFGMLPTITVGATLSDIVLTIRQNLPQLILSWFLGYLLNMALSAIAGAYGYRQITSEAV
ncbi:MAG: hypothetical protein HY243_12975 [Proteobacteria bacterium]|nr:hypothetical protein [Pseudomonadota bacterium]